MSQKIALILLAAGSGVRFGSDKLYYEIDGVPMLSKCLSLYGTGELGDLLIPRILVLQPGHEAFAQEAENLGFTVYRNAEPEKGISKSIQIGVTAVTEAKPDGVLFSVADQPYLKKETVIRLLEVFSQNPDGIIVPGTKGRTGNPVVFASRFLPEFANLKGDKGGKMIIREHMEDVRMVETAELELQDIDTRVEEYK